VPSIPEFVETRRSCGSITRYRVAYEKHDLNI
jgi:hypothetical protein